MTAAKIKVYSLRASGPSTDDDEAEVHGLTLDRVFTSVLMMQVGDCATITCTEEMAEGGLL